MHAQQLRCGGVVLIGFFESAENKVTLGALDCRVIIQGTAARRHQRLSEVRRQVLGGNLVAHSKRQRLLDGVLELANVARPVVPSS